MPELPEVETIRRGLEKRIVDRTITDIEIRYPKTFQGNGGKVANNRVKSTERRAKVLAIRMNNSYNLLFHLKMTGQLIWRAAQLRSSSSAEPRNQDFSGGHPDHNWHADLPNSTTAVVFTFDDDSKLFFNDLRKFGWCKVLSDEDLSKIFDTEYGLEPFDQNFTAEYLINKAKRIPNRKIKQFLTDQTIIAGIGNIYADELLFDARISPVRKVSEISEREWGKMVKSTIKILNLAIDQGGTTDSDYVNADGGKGGMQNYLKVYRKAGLDCPAKCGGKIERIVVGGRGTHFCPRCQN